MAENKVLVDEMTEQLKEIAGAIFSKHKSDESNPPVREIIEALINVGAAMAVTFGCPKKNFAFMAINAFDKANGNKTMSLGSVVGGSNENESLN